ARELAELGRIAGDEEAGIAVVEAELRADRLRALLADVLGKGACAFLLLAFLAPEDIAEAGLALRLRPGVHAVAEGAGAAGLRRDRPDLDLRVGRDHVREDLEAGAGEVVGDGLHDDGVSEVRLVGAVFAD